MAQRTPPPVTDLGPRSSSVSRPVEVLATQKASAAPVQVILPVYNEAQACNEVVSEVARFAAAHPEYRFLFVDDGSGDGTQHAIASAIESESLSDSSLRSRLRVIGYRTNAGKGYAVARGVAEIGAEGSDDDPVVFTDGDLAYSLDHLPVLVQALRSADVVIGSRRAPDGGYRAHLARNLMGWTYNRMARVCLGERYRDTQAGLKGFRLGAARRIFSALRVTGFAFDVEVLYLARRFGYRIGEIPAVVSPSHRKKTSGVNLLRDPRRMFVSLAGIRISGALGQYERPASGRRPLALMSFDAEEFDIPEEFGGTISPAAQLEVAAEGMRRAMEVLGEVPARATFFMTVRFAESAPDLVRLAVTLGHEVASHGLVHTGYQDAHLAESRERLEAIAGVPVRGFRPPRFAPADPLKIAEAGYTYSSSINPTWLPGRYNHFRSPRRAFERTFPSADTPGRQPLLEIPLSATPLVRFPLFWLAFKNTPQWLYRSATRWCLGADGYAALCFHPWELCDLSAYPLPRSIKRLDGRSMQSRLIRYLRWLSRRATFATCAELEQRHRAASWPLEPSSAPSQK
jgi:Glycosyl transferase family 2/Polysaccharide deacetylase